MQNKSDLPDELKLVKTEVRGMTLDGTVVVDSYCVGTKTVDHIDVTICVSKKTNKEPKNV